VRGLTLGEVAGGGLEPADEGRVAVQRPRLDSDPPFAIERPVPISARDASGFPSKEADPEGYLRAAAVLRASPVDCLVVEDAPAGIAAGIAAGVQAIPGSRLGIVMRAL